MEMVVEDGSSILDTGSDQNVIWSVLKSGNLEEKKEEKFKWKVDRKSSWEELEAVEEEFEGWEAWVCWCAFHGMYMSVSEPYCIIVNFVGFVVCYNTCLLLMRHPSTIFHVVYLYNVSRSALTLLIAFHELWVAKGDYL